MSYVAIITMGNQFMPGVRESYSAAAQKHIGQGNKVDIVDQKSLCLIPYFGMNAVKNFHACKGKLAGCTHAMFVDNDIEFIDPDILNKLIAHGKEYIVPWIQSEWTDGPNTFARPNHPQHSGLNVCDWAALSCVMVDLSIIDKVGPTIFSESFIQQEDEFTCLRLRVQGIQIWQDSQTSVKVLRPSGIMGLIERYAKL